jgi:hypothetical protein
MAEVVRILDGEQGLWQEFDELLDESRHAQQIAVAVRRCVHARLAESLGGVTLEDLCSEVRSLDEAPLDHRYVFHI